MTVKRYDIAETSGNPWESYRCIEEDEDGDYVSHEDYAALLKERDTLASEVEAIKSAHPQPFGREMMKALDAYEKYQDEVPETGMLDAFFILRDSIKLQTPTTDAAIANIQAQGVEKFADYLICPDLDNEIRAFAAQLRKESTHD